MKTFGDFFDAVTKWAKDYSNVDVQIFTEKWIPLVTPAQWQEARQLELAPDLFKNFVEDIASFYQERLMGISGENLYRMTMESGHEFFREVKRIGKENGLPDEAVNIRIPLSLSDALIMARDESAQNPAA